MCHRDDTSVSVLRIGSFDVRVSFRNNAAPSNWKELFSSYSLANIGGTSRCSLDLLLETSPGWVHPDGSHLFPRCCIRSIDSGIHLDQKLFSGELRKNGNGYSGEFLVNSDDATHLSLLIASCISRMSIDFGGLLFHAAGVLRNGRVALFSGPSGSGKTTIATELKNDGITFCVEAACVFQEKDGKLIAYPTPFSDPYGTYPAQHPNPVDSIVFIEQAETCDVQGLDALSAATNIIQNALIYSDDIEQIAETLKVAERIANSTKCFKMRFARDDHFWQRLDSALQ